MNRDSLLNKPIPQHTSTDASTDAHMQLLHDGAAVFLPLLFSVCISIGVVLIVCHLCNRIFWPKMKENFNEYKN